MHKLITGFNKSVRQLRLTESRIFTRFIQNYNTDNQEEEIVQTVLGNFVTIGINISDTKNVLTETALEKLQENIKSFESDDNLRSAVLYGHRGNFCRGIVATSHAMEQGQNLLKTLHTLKKPVIGALDGFITGFGLLLAIMCDMRVIEEEAMIGLHNKEQKLEIPPFVYERLVLTIGLAKTTELICTQLKWTAKESFSAGLANAVVERGCCQGHCITWAQSISFQHSLEKVTEQKSRILSVLSTRV